MIGLTNRIRFVVLLGLVIALGFAMVHAPALADVPDVEWERLQNGPDRALHTMIYDPVNEFFWLFGGIFADVHSTNIFNTVYRLDATNPDADWELVTVSGPLRPPPLIFHSAIYDPLRQRMVVFGGTSNNQTPVSGVNVWFLDLSDPENPSWSLVNVTGGPAGRFGHAAVYVPDVDAMVISGGFSTFTNARNDNYALLLGETPLRWVRLTSLGMSDRGGHALVYDPAGQRLIAYGGLNNLDNINATQEILTLDLSQGLEDADRWVRLSQRHLARSGRSWLRSSTP